MQVWVDPDYLHNQFVRSDRGAEMLIEKFDSLIVSTGRVVAVMTPWSDPEALMRMWCLYELVCGLRGATKGVELELRLSEEQRQGLIKAVREDTDVVTKMLVDIDITKAETSNDTDKARILEQIRALPRGEHGCNVDLKALMRRWVLETVEEAVRESDRALGEGGSAAGASGGNGEGARLEHARLLHQVALVFWTNGDYSTALELYRRALAIREDVYGNHPDTADTCFNMANVYDAQGDQAKALELYRRALAIQEEVYGKDHPDTADTCFNMANVY